MTAVTGAGGTNAVLDALQTKPKAGKETLGKNAFLELMITQLQNQDPLSPQQNGEFISQLAQFSSVEGLNNLNASVSGMAASLRSTQALQASTLVGRSVRVPSDTTLFDGAAPLTGAVVLPEATSRAQHQFPIAGGRPGPRRRPTTRCGLTRCRADRSAPVRRTGPTHPSG